MSLEEWWGKSPKELVELRRSLSVGVPEAIALRGTPGGRAAPLSHHREARVCCVRPSPMHPAVPSLPPLSSSMVPQFILTPSSPSPHRP